MVYQNVMQLSDLTHELHPQDMSQGPSDIIYQQYGPIGLVAVYVLIVLSPMLYMRFLWPWPFPQVAPYLGKFNEIVTELDDEDQD